MSDNTETPERREWDLGVYRSSPRIGGGSTSGVGARIVSGSQAARIAWDPKESRYI